MGLLAGAADDAEHVGGRKVEDRQPVEDFAPGRAHALVAPPGEAIRARGALVAAKAEAVDEPAAEARMGLQMPAQLALDRPALVSGRTPSLANPGEHAALFHSVEQRLAGGDGREYQRHAGRQCRLDMLDRARPLDLAERGVNRHDPVARNDPRQQDRHRLRVLAA